jgi:hypothetical protein
VKRTTEHLKMPSDLVQYSIAIQFLEIIEQLQTNDVAQREFPDEVHHGLKMFSK